MRRRTGNLRRAAAFTLLGVLPLLFLQCAGSDKPSANQPNGALRSDSASTSSSSANPTSDGGASATRGPRNLGARLQRSMTTFPNAFSPDGQLVARLDETCEVWDVVTGLYRGTFERAVCTGWQEEGARAHDSKSIDACKAKPALCKGAMLALSPKKDELALYGGADVIIVVDATTGAKKRELAIPSDVKSGNDRGRLAWNEESLVALFEMAEGGRGKVAKFPGGQPLAKGVTPEFDYFMQSVILQLDPFGHLVLAQDEFQTPNGISFGQRVTGLTRALASIKLDIGVPEGGKESDEDRATRAAQHILPRAAFSGDGKVVAFSSGITIVRGPNVVAEATPGAHPYVPGAVALTHDGSRVAYLVAESTEARTNRSVILRKIGEAPRTVHLPDGEVVALEWSGDGRHLALRSTSRLEIRAADTGAVELFWARVTNVAWGGEGTLAVELEGRVQMRDLTTRAELFKIPFGQRLIGRAIGADVLVTVGAKNELTSWNATSGKKGVDIKTPATSLAVSTDGKQVVSGTTLANVVVSDTETGKVGDVLPLPPEVKPAPKDKQKLVDVAFLAGGKEVVAVDAAGRAVIWDRTTMAGRFLSAHIAFASAVSPGGDFFVTMENDFVRRKDKVTARVFSEGMVVDGGCFTLLEHAEGDAGAKKTRTGQDRLARELVLAFGDPKDGRVLSGANQSPGLEEPTCLSAFVSGAPAPVPPLLARDPAPPPSTWFDELRRDGGTVSVPIHVRDHGGGATVVTLERKGGPYPAEALTWPIGPGGTPPEGKPYQMTISPDAGYSAPTLTMKACNAVDGGLCATEVTRSLYVPPR